jgi:hypothetical protein
MPIRFWWRPNDSPVPASADIVDIGLDFGGNNASSPAPITGTVAGRIKLLEVSGRGDTVTADRLMCRFHGSFMNNPLKPQDEQISFKITPGPAVPSDPFSSEVAGFDPECMLGVDAFVVTFLNREFTVFFPFLVDAASEGDFLEIVAVAEVGTIAAPTEIGRSSVLNLRVRRGTRTVDSTSNNASGAAIQYTDKVIGNRIAHHENYLFMGASFRGAAPSTVDPKPLTAVSAGLTFSPYTSGAMQVLLTTELADFMMPSDIFLQGAFPAWTLPALKAHIQPLIRTQMITTLRSIFADAGFAGMAALWADQPAAATLVAEFTASFVRPVVGDRTWRLGNSAAPMAAPYWHFYVTGSQSIPNPGEGEAYAIVAAPPRTFSGTTFFVPMTVPIGSGTKTLTQTIRIDPTHFVQGVTVDSRGTRTYANMPAFETAINAMATQVAIVAAHEIGHGLGLMHLSRVRNGTYSEPAGGSVLSIMSQTVEQSAFALDMKFHAQAKQMWKASFGTSPTMTDPTLLNKTWTDSEFATLSWHDRTQRLLRKNQNNMLVTPSLGAGKSPPPFAKQPPALQKGTSP